MNELPYDLMQRIKVGYLEAVKHFIENTPLYDITSGDNIALIYAAEMGRLKIVKYFVGLGANPADASNSALGQAALNGNMGVVKYLLTLPNVNATNNSVFEQAISGGSLDMVKYIYERGNVDISACGHEGMICAVRRGWLDIVQYISCLPGINMAYSNNQAIRYATHFKKYKIIEYLLTMDSVDPLVDGACVLKAAQHNKHLLAMAMITYWYPSEDENIIKQFKLAHQDIMIYMRNYILKMTTLFAVYPAPIIIEIINQYLELAIYVPLHYKWDMVVAIKHFKEIPHIS